ncbi:TetR family transcriptional regulator [Halalkalibacter nanhaiisediminis]|uniref:TetR family transcriptional regulator n=1 Tax=Halalkalibacter nanhaiisediminis TaxID=688079 RepID=A0A562QU33_9BACI|nr:TetR family transcriptional regulator [Halalkalibacter nanhaiisediminis]
MVWVKKRATERRKQILKATFQAVVDKGYEGVTLQDIADYAGVSKGVTNYYFENKEDIFAHLLEWLTSKIYEREMRSIEKEEKALAKLQTYLDNVFASPTENRQFYRVYLDFLSQVKGNVRYQQVNQQFYQNCWGIGQLIAELGTKEGVFIVKDTEMTAKLMRGVIDGMLIQWLMQDEDDLHKIYKKMCLEGILTLLHYQREES